MAGLDGASPFLASSILLLFGRCLWEYLEKVLAVQLSISGEASAAYLLFLLQPDNLWTSQWSTETWTALFSDDWAETS